MSEWHRDVRQCGRQGGQHTLKSRGRCKLIGLPLAMCTTLVLHKRELPLPPSSLPPWLRCTRRWIPWIQTTTTSRRTKKDLNLLLFCLELSTFLVQCESQPVCITFISNKSNSCSFTSLSLLPKQYGLCLNKCRAARPLMGLPPCPASLLICG